MNSSNSDGVYDKSSYRDYWTTWFNVDSPWEGDGDYETVEHIQQMIGKICLKGFQICAAQCQVRGHEGEVFDQTTLLTNNSDILQRRCTTEGIICKNSDQSSRGGQCQDYEIRFKCHHTGENPSSTSSSNYRNPFDIRVYVILALVPLLLIFARLVWVFLRRRRQHQAEASTETSRFHADGNRGTSLTKPPPSYHDLFGKLGSSMFTISRDNLPVCSQCACRPCSIAQSLSQTEVTDKSKTHKQRSLMGIDSSSHTEGVEQMVSSLSSRVDRNNACQLPRGSGLFQATPSDSETTVGIDSRETPVGIDTIDTIVGIDSRETTVGIDSGEAVINIDTRETPVGIDSRETTVGIDSRETTVGIDSRKTTVRIDSQEITIGIDSTDSRESTDVYTELNSNPNPPISEAAQVNDLDIANNRSEICQDLYLHAIIPATPPSAAPSTSTEVHQDSMCLPPTLNSSPLKSSIISEPCACKCHRTIPSKQKGVLGYVNSGYTPVENDHQSENHLVHMNMHRSVLHHHENQSDMLRSTSATQLEPPTYEDALEILKFKGK